MKYKAKIYRYRYVCIHSSHIFVCTIVGCSYIVKSIAFLSLSQLFLEMRVLVRFYFFGCFYLTVPCM